MGDKIKKISKKTSKKIQLVYIKISKGERKINKSHYNNILDVGID